MKKILHKFYYIIIMVLLVNVSCDRSFLETSPTDSVGVGDATSTADNLMSIVNGMHRSMYVRQGGQGYNGQGGMMVILDSFGDDLVHTGTGLNWHMTAVRWQSPNNENDFINQYPWDFYYRQIRNANTVIKFGATASGDTTVRDKAIGEAYAYRAFCYFQLVQIYGKRYIKGANNDADGGVPLRIDLTDAPMARSTVEEVYTQINKDLDASLALLQGKTRTHKSHFTDAVVRGLKARVALTQQNWTEAATQAKLARANFALMSNADYTAGFNKLANGEWMWGVEITADQTDFFGDFGAYMSRNFNSSTIRLAPKAISKLLFDAFPATDVRTKNFDVTGLHTSLNLLTTFVKKPYTSQKFIAVSSSDGRVDVPFMRAAEMYLIEAEALARAGDETGSKAVFTLLEKNRNPSYTTTSSTGTAYINEVLRSRRLELWGEGFRFFDLKRLNLNLDRTGSNHVATVINNVYTVPNSDLRWNWLIPITEINANKLCKQNPK